MTMMRHHSGEEKSKDKRSARAHKLNRRLCDAMVYSPDNLGRYCRYR